MRTIIFLFLILCFVANAQAQNSPLPAKFSNDSIRFAVAHISPQLKGKGYMTAPRNLIQVTMTDADRTALKKMTKTDWLAALNDPGIDWAANLLLYQLYQKDALLFIINKTRDQWLLSARKKDLKYWEETLK